MIAFFDYRAPFFQPGIFHCHGNFFGQRQTIVIIKIIGNLSCDRKFTAAIDHVIGFYLDCRFSFADDNRLCQRHILYYHIIVHRIPVFVFSLQNKMRRIYLGICSCIGGGKNSISIRRYFVSHKNPGKHEIRYSDDIRSIIGSSGCGRFIIADFIRC